MTNLCERCKREMFKQVTCNYCSRKLCYNCMKSSQRVQKVTMLVICKDCWSNLKKRTAFKNKRTDLRKVETAFA